MELRCAYESRLEKNNEAVSCFDYKESEAESLGSIGNGRKNGGPKENWHSVLNSVNKIVSQIKKPPHRRSGSPLDWFPRKKTDSYLKRKIRLLQENEGLNLSLDETLGNANPHYTKIAREKIAAREAARKAMEARKAAMVEASWCRILRAARVQSKEAEDELEQAEKCAKEAFEAARANGVMMYDRPDGPMRPCEVESFSCVGGISTHTITASFETAFEVDKEVMAAVKKAFIQLANHPLSSNKEEFKELLWKISQNPEDNAADPDLSDAYSESEFYAECNGDDGVNDSSGVKSFTELVNAMLGRLKGLQEAELASLATIVATCGLNAALLEVENSKDKQGTGGARRNSCTARFMDGYLNMKEPDTEVPGLDKFLVKRVSRLEKEVLEARNSRCRQTPRESVVTDPEAKPTPLEPVSDLGSILVKHVSKFEKEIQEARRSRKNSSLAENVKTVALSRSTLRENECEGPRTSQELTESMQKTNAEVDRTVSPYQYKENIDSNILVSPSVSTEEKHHGRKLKEITNGTSLGAEVSVYQDHMERLPAKHVSRLERAKQEVLNSFSSQEQSGLDKILVKPVHRLEKEKMQAAGCGNEYAMQRDRQKHRTDATVPESLDKILVKHVSRLEKDRMELGTKYGPMSTVKRRDQPLEKVEGLDEILVKRQSKLEKAKLAASQQPAFDIIKIKQWKHKTEATCSESLDKVLVRHQPELQKAKFASAQQSEDCIKRVDTRKEARERELQEAWGGLSLGNSIRPHLSRLERDRAAWKQAEDEERLLAREVMK